jgi:hypothetical protein
MHPAMQGFLVGLAVALFLIVFEYLAVKKQVEERASLKHQKPQSEAQDKNRVRAVVNFCLFVPPAFAAGFWLLD